MKFSVIPSPEGCKIYATETVWPYRIYTLPFAFRLGLKQVPTQEEVERAGLDAPKHFGGAMSLDFSRSTDS